MLLIHWHGYSRAIIELDQINFLTGKTASGKSTIIDALQLVLLGDTSGSFFNKATNEKSVRTLRSYLFGETGDDGETGSVYLRKGAFSSYLVLEFENTERGQLFCAGIVCDCHDDLNYENKWFVMHHDATILLVHCPWLNWRAECSIYRLYNPTMLVQQPRRNVLYRLLSYKLRPILSVCEPICWRVCF
jgi:uncharacterized protein YPO0396